MRVLSLGTFDLTHQGHAIHFRNAARLGPLWVAVNPDDFVARYKRPPILSLDERLGMVRAMRWVEYAFPNFGAEDSKIAIEYARAGGNDRTPVADRLIIVHGDDWTGEAYMEQLQVTQEWLDERKVTLAYVPYTGGISTSEIIERVRRQ